MGTFLKKLLWFAAAFAVLGGAMASLQQVRIQRTFVPQQMDSFYLPPQQTLRLASLGYTRLLADLLWVKTLVYFGEEMNGARRQTWLSEHVWRVVGLDPSFELAYSWGGAAMLYGGRIIDNETVRLSNAFYREAMRRFPGNWRYPAALAFNLVYEYKPESDEEAARNREEAIRLFEAASRMEGAPGYLKVFAVSEMNKAGMDRVAAEYLREAYAAATDEEERKMLARRLEKLDRTGIEELRYQQERLDEMMRLLPYAEPDLSILLGPRPDLIRLDGTWTHPDTAKSADPGKNAGSGSSGEKNKPSKAVL